MVCKGTTIILEKDYSFIINCLIITPRFNLNQEDPKSQGKQLKFDKFIFLQ